MSGPAVVVGYLFVAPSVLGVILGIILMIVSGGATASAASTAHEEVSTSLRSQGIEETVIVAVLAGEQVDEGTLGTYEQRAAVSSAKSRLAGAEVGAGAAAALSFGFALFMIVGSFVGGLIGYLLTMKKKILQCTSCEAVVQAS